MATVAAISQEQCGTAPTVHTCYDVLDAGVAGGVTDFTEGIYVNERNDRAAYLAAQSRQAEYLLDQVACGPGTRLLDIGCGYGRILEHAARRGATPIGITISLPQMAYGQARGLDIRELNYRDIFNSPDRAWDRDFDAVVANGSLEHFVQVADAVAGRANDIYGELFAICRRLLRDSGRLVTTAIHFRKIGQVNPFDMLGGPYIHPRGSDNYHFAMVLERTFGGWYPEPGQLARCAAPYFELIAEEDGTDDYHHTSEYWLRRQQWSTAFNPAVWWSVARKGLRRPLAVAEMLRCLAWDQSWAWQFRPPAPTRLLRQTWLGK
ncbi:MAG TPA: class I SAM-dependent methyltransferase [Lacipirellulaceae bacterium]|jgi:cyclopropane fatty-acyl-phospholipid synthase-like methyltransferase